MKRKILIGTVLVLSSIGLATVCFAASIGAENIWCGISGTTQGILSIYRGSSTTPGILSMESCDGTQQYFTADNDGGLRTHTSSLTSDTDGEVLLKSSDLIFWENEIMVYEGSIVVDEL